MAKTKGATKTTATELRRYRHYREVKKYSVGRAAKAIGRSEGWGYRQEQKERDYKAAQEERLPAPKRFDELDGGVKDCLSDFSLFEESFFAYRPVPWRRDAAMRVAEMLLDPTPDKHYVVINTPPGAGKTSLFTFIIPVWLIVGGGSQNPELGRAIRILLGHAAKTTAEHYVQRIKRVLESPRSFSYFDKFDQKRHKADLGLIKEFGRFKPERALGEPSLWKGNEFTVVQLADIDLAEKEPTCQAASYDSEFLGERVDYSPWDDLVNRKTAMNADAAEKMAEWHDDYPETRIEEGGVHAVIGQRLSPLDLYRHNLNKKFERDGEMIRKYDHIVYPAHHEATCDGDHRQWDPKTGDGCLLDAQRLPWKGDLETRQSDPRYRTVYQQEDADPADVLVQEVWLDGGRDQWGYPAPGCYDRERGFMEWPKQGPLIDYVLVDPSVANWWAVEWWALDPETMQRFLIWGSRRRMQAGGHEGFLDWDNKDQKHVGLMEKLQYNSGELGHPIRMWVVEANAAHKYLFQSNHFDSWRRKWANVRVEPHDTQRNKTDDDFGIEGLIPMPYKQGLKRLPRKSGDIESLNYLRHKIHELTKWPHVQTEDTVMADWFGELWLPVIKELSKPLDREVDIDLPDYVLDQQEWISVA